MGHPRGTCCPTCKVPHSQELFHRSKRRVSGLSTYCKKCDAARYHRTGGYATHKQPPGVRRRATLKFLYGLTPEEFSFMVGSQMNLCKACRVPMTMISHKPESCHVDHDHTTGKIRGLLCHTCNSGLGMLKDDPKRLRALADYVEAA